MMKQTPTEVDSMSPRVEFILQPAFLNHHFTSFHQIFPPTMCNVWQSFSFFPTPTQPETIGIFLIQTFSEIVREWKQGKQDPYEFRSIMFRKIRAEGMLTLITIASNMQHSLVGKIPWRKKRPPSPVFFSWTEEPGGLQTMGLKTVH